MILKKKPLEFLIELLAGLSDEIPIYKKFMDSDIDNIPDSYILVGSNINSQPFLYGDGKVKARSATCNINLISKGKADYSESIHIKNKKKIEDLLVSMNIAYSDDDFGYDKESDSTEHSFRFEVSYYG